MRNTDEVSTRIPDLDDPTPLPAKHRRMRSRFIQSKSSSIADRGRFEAKDFGRKFVETFQLGVYSGYIDQATRETLENYSGFVEGNPGTSSTSKTVATTTNSQRRRALPVSWCVIAGIVICSRW